MPDIKACFDFVKSILEWYCDYDAIKENNQSGIDLLEQEYAICIKTAFENICSKRHWEHQNYTIDEIMQKCAEQNDVRGLLEELTGGDETGIIDDAVENLFIQEFIVEVYRHHELLQYFRDKESSEFRRIIHSIQNDLLELRAHQDVTLNLLPKPLDSISVIDAKTYRDFLKQNWFSPKLEKLLALDLLGREWAYNHIAEEIFSKKRRMVLTLLGAPGFGKSMLIAHSKQKLVNVKAIYAFDTFSEESQNIDTCIAEISCQLAESMEDYCSFIVASFSNKSFEIGSGSRRFYNLIVRPFHQLSLHNPEHEDIVISIDALDEANQPCSLLDFIREYESMLPSWLHFLVSSRVDTTIMSALLGITNHNIINVSSSSSLAHKNSVEDIRLFCEKKLADKLDELGFCKSEQAALFENIATKSDGLFAYAIGVCRIIVDDLEENPKTNLSALNYALPNGLSGLYYDTMRRKNSQFNSNEQAKGFNSFWRKPLSIIIGSPTKMPVGTLKHLMKWNDTDYNDFLIPLLNVLEVSSFKPFLAQSSIDTISVFHLSFSEWLNDSSRSGEYYTSKTDGRTALAKECYSLYQELLPRIDRICESTNPEEVASFYNDGDVTYLAYNLLFLLREEGMSREYADVVGNINYLFVTDSTITLDKLWRPYTSDARRGKNELRIALRESVSPQKFMLWNVYESSIFSLLDDSIYREEDIDPSLIKDCENAWQMIKPTFSSSDDIIRSHWVDKLMSLVTVYEKTNQDELCLKYSQLICHYINSSSPNVRERYVKTLLQRIKMAELQKKDSLVTSD